MRCTGNWWLGLHELWVRDPCAEFYALFQDDLVAVRNIRPYMEARRVPERCYFNLFSFPQNEELAPKGLTGWYLSNQRGRGAVALVFPHNAAEALLSARHMVGKLTDLDRGFLNLDGGVITAMIQAGFRECCHAPSLVQHTGRVSTMGNRPHPQSGTYRDGDAMTFLEAPRCSVM